MGGITSGIGLASGIDSGTLIERLLSLEARPRTLAQQRLIQLQSQQAAYFDLNSRMNALKTAAAKFRTGKVFDSMKSTSSDPLVMTATSSTNAQTGNYTFLVDRLVTSQQLLSRGFADKDSAALGASSFTFESAVARLDRDTNLADLNGGEGIERGKISISVNSGTAVSVDLSKAATINEVIEAINGSGTGVTATAEGTRLVLRAASYDEVVRWKPRFVAWRRHWAHAVEAWTPQDLPADLPTWLLDDGPVCVAVADRLHWRGRCAVDAREAQLRRQELDAVLQRSETAFPVNSLGL